MTYLDLRVVPIELAEANAHIEEFHRHHKRVQGHRFSIGVMDGERLCAVACVGRPTSGVDAKKVLEVTRLCSDGTFNACSMLYSAAARAGKALGYLCIQTYIYESENGASLKASGWRFVRKAYPSGRHRKRSDGTVRDLTHVEIPKTLWRRDLQGIEVLDSDLAHHRRS